MRSRDEVSPAVWSQPPSQTVGCGVITAPAGSPAVFVSWPHAVAVVHGTLCFCSFRFDSCLFVNPVFCVVCASVTMSTLQSDLIPLRADAERILGTGPLHATATAAAFVSTQHGIVAIASALAQQQTADGSAAAAAAAAGVESDYMDGVERTPASVRVRGAVPVTPARRICASIATITPGPG